MGNAEQNVLIKMKGRQTVLDDEDSYELITVGTYKKEDDGKYVVTYEGSEVTGYENTTTVLNIEGENVSMIRYGTTPTQMVFEKGNKYTGHYETPFGFLSVGVMTNEMTVALGDDGGNLELDYYVQLNDNEPIRSGLSIEITKTEEVVCTA